MLKTIDEMLNPKQFDFLLNDNCRINLLTGSVRFGKIYISLLKWSIFVLVGCELFMVGKNHCIIKKKLFKFILF